MPLPGLSTTILTSGLGVTTPATSRAHVVGVAEQGPSNTPTLISNQRQLRETFGTYGPLVDTVGAILDTAGGPVVCTRTTASTAATYDDGGGAASSGNLVADTGAGVDNEINLAVATSAPKVDADLVVTIVTGGALAATTFTYSLDGGQTTSPELAAGASVALGGSGITLEFEAGSTAPYVAGAVYSGTAKAPHYSAANLTTAFNAIDLSVLVFDYFVFAGDVLTSAAAATLFATIATKMTAYVAQDKFYRAIMGGGDDTAANCVSAFSGLTSDRVAVMFGKYRTAAPSATVGRALPQLPALIAAATRAAGNVMSTDLAQTAGATSVGPLVGAPEDGLSHNEFTQNAGLDDIKVGTLRTYSNLRGVFITNCWLKSSTGSDFEYWQHGRIMDEACKVVSNQHAQLISSSVVTKTDGTGSLAEFSALAIEQRVQRALDNTIGSAARGIGPATVDGGTGHVSDLAYQVDRTNNVLSTKTLIATISLVPRGYLKFFSQTFSYKLAL